MGELLDSFHCSRELCFSSVFSGLVTLRAISLRVGGASQAWQQMGPTGWRQQQPHRWHPHRWQGWFPTLRGFVLKASASCVRLMSQSQRFGWRFLACKVSFHPLVRPGEKPGGLDTSQEHERLLRYSPSSIHTWGSNLESQAESSVVASPCPPTLRHPIGCVFQVSLGTWSRDVYFFLKRIIFDFTF